jgi:signal transduction histidine kinase
VTRPVDEGLVRRRSRRVAAQVAVLVATAMLVTVGLATFLVVRGQQASTDRLLRTTAVNADDVGDPPAGAWIVLRRGTRVSASAGLPADVAAALPSTDGYRTLAADDTHFRVYTAQRGEETVQVVYDLAPDRAQRDRMLRVMGAAAGLSLVVAAAVGVLIGRRAVRPLAEALALQRTFVADASHELRTPVTLLSTRVQVLERDLPPELPPALRSDVTGIRADVQRLDDVIEDLLVAATPDRAEERSSVDLRALVRDAVASAQAHADSRGVTLLLDDDGEARASVTAAAVRRAVLSLVDNAVDHTPSGGTVTVATRQAGRHVAVTVSDSGPGLSKEDAERVFERFHSGGHRAGRAHYGLGLALTNEVALRHGGRLAVLPSTGGAVFELTLPV